MNSALSWQIKKVELFLAQDAECLRSGFKPAILRIPDVRRESRYRQTHRMTFSSEL
jgi:hypothetical protein